MQRRISIPVFPPTLSPRPGRAVRLKPSSIAWALALIAGGLGPASVMAEAEAPTTNITLHNASGIPGIGAGEKAHSKTGHDLLALHREYQAYLQKADAQARGPSGFRSRNFMAPTSAGYVSIDTAAAGDPEALAADLEALGLEGGAVFGRMVSGSLPVSAIPALAALDSLKFARLAYAMTLAGAVTSQGDAVIRADIARSTLGVDGGVDGHGRHGRGAFQHFQLPRGRVFGSGEWRLASCRGAGRRSLRRPRFAQRVAR